MSSVVCLNVVSQELFCNVQVQTRQIQGTNKQKFETLKKSITEFMNNTNWTNHMYEFDERIECNLLLNITDEISTEEYTATLQIQARRPVYNTSYNSVLLNYIDNDIRFKYVEFEPLEFSPATYTSELSSLLAYYAYIILGLDYDSFAFEGGTEYFQIAEKIVNNAQNPGEKGWRSQDSRSRKNRYWLIENILGSEYSKLREFWYNYHRQGLDKMEKELNIARTTILNDLNLLREVSRNKPDPFMFYLQIILDAKSDEFVQIFKESSQTDKVKALAILREIDPANANKYNQLRQ